MRRLAAIFAPKRSSKSEASDAAPSESQYSQHTVHTTKSKLKARGSFLRSLSRGTSTGSPSQPEPPIPPVRTGTGAYSSASSSSGGPHTPDDDRASLFRNKSGNSYLPNPWPVDLPPSNEPYTVNSLNPRDRHSIKQSQPMLSPRNPSAPRHSHSDTDEDTSSEESSESEAPALLTTIMSPIDYLRTLTVNASEPPFSPPPLLHIPGCPVFPRSCNLSHALQRDETLHSDMLKRRLLHRLERGHLSRSDEQLIKSLTNRQGPPPRKRPSLGLDDTALDARHRLAKYSQGLKHWISRPCFEERLVLYMPTQSGEVVMRGIVGTNLGVAELEFSEGIEALAGLYEPFDLLPADAALSIHSASPTNATPPLPPLSMSSSSSTVSSMLPSPAATSPPALSPATSPPGNKSQPSQSMSHLHFIDVKILMYLCLASSSSQNRNSYRAAPSPLRIESSSVPSPKPTAAPLSTSPSQASTVLASPLSSPTIVLSPSSPEPPELPARSSPPANPPMKGVRFAEEEKEDGVPLGYVLRIKQKREQKARFLEAEKQRRAHDDDRRKFEEERRRQDAERKKWEQERAVWEKEKRAMEEERKKKLYAEELAAARSRRDGTRFGNMPRSDSDPTFTWDGSERERERMNRGRVSQETYSRPLYDTNAPTPRRQGSDPTIADPRTRKESSPGSSRPSSVINSGSNNGSVRGSSRPPSMYSNPQSSVPDVSTRERRESKGSRRVSLASLADSQHSMSALPAFPWNMNMMPPVPPLPTMGMAPMPVYPVYPYMMDAPLLPPSPPFMMQQFGRPHQQRSHSSSPTTGTNRLPASQSSDRVNKQGISPVRHERRASGDISEIQRSRASTPRSASNDRSSKVIAPSTSRAPGTRTSSGPNPPSGGSKPRSSSRHSAVPSSYIPPQTSAAPPPPQKPIQPIPVMTASWSQPGFQNLSRPQANRRQTMIS